MIYGIILAGGKGIRMNSELPKQFISLLNKPIIIHTIEAMINSNCFDKIYIAIHKDYKDYFKKILEEFNLSKDKNIIILNGGETRLESLENAFIEIQKNSNDDNDILVFHDAVRPFVSKKILEDGVKNALIYGACVATTSVIDTQYIVQNGFIVDFPNRESMFNGQSPDCFRLDVIKRALESLSDEDRKSITGTVQMCRFMGFPVKTYEGDYSNIKITTKSDLLIAEQILKKRENDESMCCQK